jgi:hypothetical protein
VTVTPSRIFAPLELKRSVPPSWLIEPPLMMPPLSRKSPVLELSR